MALQARDANALLQEGGPGAVRTAFDSALAAAGDDAAPDDSSAIRQWPELKNAAAHGIVGEMAKLATANSEADPVAVMGTALVWAGAAFGRARSIGVGDTKHHTRLFSALVGNSSRARKGTSIDPVRRFFTAAEQSLQAQSTLPFPSGLSLKCSAGPLSSGEGLIDAVRDARGDDDQGGVKDKRLLCIEGELGSVLRACQRQGNTLSTVLRVAWDGWKLAPLTKHDKIEATEPHISIIAHITRQELRELLAATDIWNGFANRFLWLAVRRNQIVPLPKPMQDDDVQRVGREMARLIARAHERSGIDGTVVMSNAAQSHWVDTYAELTQDHPGILGAVTSRAEAQTLRLSLTYALLDGADRIERQHVEAALALWRYAFDSAAYLFGGVEIDPVAQQIMSALEKGPQTQTEISGLFGRHQSSARLASALADLQDRGRIVMIKEKTDGRPRQTWRLRS